MLESLGGSVAPTGWRFGDRITIYLRDVNSLIMVLGFKIV